LLEQSNLASINTTFSWVDFQLPTPYTVASGTTYGLAIMGNVPVNLMIVSGTGQRTGGPGYGSYTKGFTNPFGTIWFNDPIGAMSIYATGISSPSPTSTPTPVPTASPPPSSSNLAIIPNTWGGYAYFGEIVYTSVSPPSANQISAYDTSVYRTAGQGSIRLDPYLGLGENTGREADGPYLTIKPGDHIVFSCWMKTTGSTAGLNGDPLYGARIGIDFYANRRITATQSPDGSTWNPITNVYPVGQTFVPWGTSTWTQVTINFIVAQTYLADGLAGYPLGQSATPTACIPWMQVMNPSDGGPAWFADAQLYINP
jgi:hypothetical protein